MSRFPPLFSAVKIDGEAAYRRVRRGEDIAITPRPVFVHDLTLDAYANGIATFTIVCAKGFYVRSFARDIGRKVGTFAHVASLRRTKVSKITLQDAISLAKLEEMTYSDAMEKHLKSCGWVLDDILDLKLTALEVAKVRNGLPLHREDLPVGSCAMWHDGQLVGFAHVDESVVNPKRILNLN